MRKHHIGLMLLFAAGSGHAALHDRGDGFIYDDVLDITWTQNANINGLDTWANQTAWAAGYSQTHSEHGTISNWRLPSMDRNGDGTVVNCLQVPEAACRDNEYGYLYAQYGITTASPGGFTNLTNWFYWSSTDKPSSSTLDLAWDFSFQNGFQPGDSKALSFYAWAVRDGDIDDSGGIPIPTPAGVDIEPVVLHPHHDGQLGPRGIAAFPDDVIPVVIFGARMFAGDISNFDPVDIDVPTLRFGPNSAEVSPIYPPEFGIDVDSDGIDDARFNFVMSEAGFGCSDTDGSIGGEMNNGLAFGGSDTFTADCNAQCHN